MKWSGRAHIHNDWLPESQLLNTARRKLLNFKKRHVVVVVSSSSDAAATASAAGGGATASAPVPVNFMEEEWLLPERLVARRPSPSNPGWEVLVKWQGQVGGCVGGREGGCEGECVRGRGSEIV